MTSDLPQRSASRPDDPRRWFDEAVRLDAENRRLRTLMTSLLLAIAEHDELLEFGRRLIDRRFPEGRA
jgi:hypothetical protein